MKEFDDAMLDIAWKNLESQYNRFKDSDTKAIGIITISGILMTFITKSTNCGQASMVFFILTSLSFFATILLSVMVIRTREFGMVLTNNLLDELKGERKERQIRGIIGTIGAAEQNICIVSNTKAKNLKLAIYALSVSIVLLIFYSLSSFC